MLVIYVIFVLVGFFGYTIIKIKIQQWLEDLKMSRLSLQKHYRNSRKIQNANSVPVNLHDVVEITDDESDDSAAQNILENKGDTSEIRHRYKPSSNKQSTAIQKFKTAEPDEIDCLDQQDEASNFKLSTLSKFEQSTDSLETDEDDRFVGAGKSSSNFKSTLFSWERKHPTKNIKTNSRNKKKNYFKYDNSESSDESSTPNQTSMLFDDKYKRTKKKFTNFSNTESVEELSDCKKRKENIAPEVMIQHEITIAGTKVKLPVKPYPCQIAVMNMLIQGCSKGQNCLLESPTGSGKTLALLCGVLAWQEHHNAEIEKELSKRMQNDYVDDKNSHEIQPWNDFLGNSSYDFGAKGKNMFDAHGTQDFTSTDDDDKKQFKVPKIYYGTRTHRQIQQVIREFKKTVYRHKKMTILSSREHTCIQNTNRNKTELCNELLDPAKHIGCPYYNEGNKRVISSFNALQNSGLDTAWDIEDLVALGREERVCPYFAARNLMVEADIIFCPYNYLVDPDIRESMQINLKDEIIILDEAHNIEDICRDVASVRFRHDDLTIVIHECESISKQRSADFNTYNILQNYIADLTNFIQRAGVEIMDSNSDSLSSPYWTGTELKELFNMNNIGDSRYMDVIAAGKAAILDYNKAKDDLRGPASHSPMPTISNSTQRILEHLMFMIQTIFSEKYVNDYRACIIESTAKDVKYVEDNTWHSTRKNEQRVRTLKLICMNPGVIFSPLASSARSIILASGTLAPTASFQSELGTTFPHMLSANHVIPKDQVYATCIPKGPNGVSLKANYQNVNSWSFQDELGRLVLDVCESIPHGVLCFFSSYHVMNTQIDRWKKNGTWGKLERHKYIFLEPRHGGSLSQIMLEYREAIEDTAKEPNGQINGALLFAVFRGKVAEGIDFSDNEARCVLTIGIPYAVKKDPVIDMKYKYNDLNVPKGLLNGSEWYTVQAFRALNQALGRCVRHRNDWGVVLLVDERFLLPNNIHYLPKWIKSMWVEQTRFNLKEDLREFVTKQKARDAKNGVTY